MKRVILYGRTSTKDQSTELQFREMFEYTKNRGWILIKQIEDTSTGTNLKRPGFQEVMRYCRERKTDVILVWKLDRAFRSLRDCINTLQEFSELNVEFISVKDNLDLTTSAGKLMMHVIAAFASFEADIIKERVRAGIDNARAKGKKLGRPRTIDLEEVIRLRKTGMSLSQIAKKIGTTKSAVSKILSKNSQKIAININSNGYKDSSSKVE